MTARGAARAAWSSWRAAAVARSTLSELGLGCVGAVGVLAMLFLALRVAPVEGPNAGEVLRRGFERDLDSLAWISGILAALVSSWSVGRDRSSARLPRFLAAPLTSLEYAAGKTLGCSLGCAGLLLPLQVLLLAAASEGPGRNPELYAPRATLLPSPTGAGEEGRFLRAGEALSLHFELPPAAGPFELECTVDALETSLDAELLPAIRIHDALGVELGEIAVPRVPLYSFRAPLPPCTTASLDVTLAAAARQQGALRVAAGGVRLRGAPGSWTRSGGRSLLGMAALILLATALAVALATVLPDVLSLLLTTLVLSVALHRVLLQEVMDSVAAARSGWVHHLAAAMGSWLHSWPDLGALVGSRLLTAGFEPFGVEDPWRTLPWLLWSAAALAAAALGTAWGRRRPR